MRREVSIPRTWKLSVYPAPADPLHDRELVVRLPKKVDSNRLATYGADESLLEGLWVGWPPEKGEIEIWAGNCIADWQRGWTHQGSDLGPALIIDEHTPFVGIINLIPHPNKTVEFSYGVIPTARRRHVASRGVRLASDWALSEGQFRRIELRIGEDNFASQRVAENAGFQFIERFELFVTATGRTHVDWLYSKTRE